MVPKEDFPILENNPGLVYLDSACTSLKPKQVIEAEAGYYEKFGACGGRSSHRLGRLTSDKLDESRRAVASFVNAKPEELIWTRNTTEGLNIIINGLDYSKRNKVVTTVLEHHSVLLPLMRLRDNGTIKLEILDCDNEGQVDIGSWSAVDGQTALVVTSSGNNTTGAISDTRKIAKIAHDNGALACIDGAQGVPHHRTDFKKSDVDFLCFSGHKMLGPTGIGALVAKKEQLCRIRPLMSGGGTVRTVSTGKVVQMEDHTRFEAGVQHYSGIIGFAAACNYLAKAGMEKIEGHEKKLSDKLREAIENSGAGIYGPKKTGQHGALYSFNFRNGKPHDVALMLDKEDIAVRSGFFCAQPAMEAMGARNGAVRASCYLYNTMDDIKKFGEALEKVKMLYD